MERLSPDSPLARSLEAGRAASNSAVAHARHANPRFDTAAFSAFLCGPLDRLVRAVAVAAPGQAEAAARALFELALELFAGDLVGDARNPALHDAWDRVLPAAAPALATDPRGLAAAVSNLALNIQRERPAAAARWADAAVAVASNTPDPLALLDGLLVLAWRCGLAHFRDSALARWQLLPDRARLVTLGMAASAPLPPDIGTRLADPWWAPSTPVSTPADLRIVGRAGGFRGFGGPFARPPQVATVDDRVVAWDRDGCWSVHADHFGVMMKRLSDDPPEGRQLPSASFTIDQAGRVIRGGARRTFEELKESTSFASTEWTLAVTLRNSHWVFLVASATEPGVA